MTSDVSVYNQVFRRICELRSRPQPSTNFWRFSLSLIFCNISYKQNIYSFVRLDVPSPPHNVTYRLRHKNFQFLYVFIHAFSVISPLAFNINFIRLLLTHTQKSATRSFSHISLSSSSSSLYLHIQCAWLQN